MTTIQDLQQVAIVGGGLAGLALARILQVHRVEVVVYEHHALRDTAALCGPLALQPELGQRALRAARLGAPLQAMLRTEAQDVRICDKAGQTHWEEQVPASARDRFEVDGAALRDTLIDSLYPAVLRWDHSLKKIVPAAAGGHTLHFAHGERAHADLVLGADGAHSRVRAGLSATPASIAPGINKVQLTLSQVDRTQPALGAWVGPGCVMALQDHTVLRAQRHSQDLQVQLAWRGPTAWLNSLTQLAPAAARVALAEHFADWAPQWAGLIRCSDDALQCEPLYAAPPHCRWETRPDMSLLGNAAHVAAGLHHSGADWALHNAAALAHALLQGPHVAAGLRAYEAALFAQADAAQARAAAYMQACLAADGAPRLATWMAAQAGSAQLWGGQRRS